MRDDKLIEAMARAMWDAEPQLDEWDRAHPEARCRRMNMARAALAALQRELWVPVSERLPPEGVDVLVLHDYGQIVGNPAHRDCGKRYGHKITRRYGNGFLSELLETGQATHWMPLPDAPQPEEAL